MVSEEALQVPDLWSDVKGEIEQFGSSLKGLKGGTNIYLCLMLTAFPFSILFTCMAFGQASFTGFIQYLISACFVAGSPLVITAFNQKTWKNFMTRDDSFTWTALHPPEAVPAKHQAHPSSVALLQKYRQTFLWQGWQIHHVALPRAESEVPILLVHGFGGSVGHWRHNIPVLARHHSVYAIDLLGFGDSDKPDTSYSLNLWVEQVYEFWRTFIKVPVVLVGNSLGSLTCLSVAAAHPEMVRGVAMISLPDTSSHQDAVPLVLRSLLARVQSMLLSPLVLRPLFHLLSQPWVVRCWAQFAYAYKEAVTDELLEILIKPSRAQGSATAFCSILRAMLSPQFSPNLKVIFSKLNIPALLMWGKQDRMIPSSLAYRYLEYNPLLRLVELENAGHCAHDECPERVNVELLTWIHTQILALSPSPCRSAA